jgi:soluble lytic murein transglycosylase-like protein
MRAFDHKQVLAAASVIAALGLASEEVFAPNPPAGAACAAPAELEIAAEPELGAEQLALAAFLARRYQVARSVTERVVAAAWRAGDEVGLDPLTVLAVVSVESGFNPVAESSMGAKGLMQIIPRYHRAKLDAEGGEEAVLDPESNIFVGARILQEYVHRAGTLEAGLQRYNGAWRDSSALYAQKVLAERARLDRALRGTFVTALNSRGG